MEKSGSSESITGSVTPSSKKLSLLAFFFFCSLHCFHWLYLSVLFSPVILTSAYFGLCISIFCPYVSFLWYIFRCISLIAELFSPNRVQRYEAWQVSVEGALGNYYQSGFSVSWKVGTGRGRDSGCGLAVSPPPCTALLKAVWAVRDRRLCCSHGNESRVKTGSAKAPISRFLLDQALLLSCMYHINLKPSGSHESGDQLRQCWLFIIAE